MLADWLLIAVVVVGVWSVWKLSNLTADAFSQWWNAAHPREDEEER